MTTPHNVGAGRRGSVTPRCDKAPWQGRFIEGQGQGNSADCAELRRIRKTAAVVDQAARLGIECRQTGPESWLLCHSKGAVIGAVQGDGALAAAVAGFEAAANDVRELMRRMRGAA